MTIMETPEKYIEKRGISLEEVRKAFDKLTREVSDAYNVLNEKEVELTKLFETHKKLILERLQKFVSSKLTEDDLEFDPGNLSVEIVSIGGHIPDEGIIYENIDMPHDIEKIGKAIAGSLIDLGLTAEFGSNFFGK